MPAYAIVTSLPSVVYFVRYDSDTGAQDTLACMAMRRATHLSMNRVRNHALYSASVVAEAHTHFDGQEPVTSLKLLVCNSHNDAVLESALKTALARDWHVDGCSIEVDEPHESINVAVRSLASTTGTSECRVSAVN